MQSPWLKNLVAWYRENQRDLPWRKNQDPYRVMVSEFMLVQTTVATVLPRYESFLKEFPTLKSLAKAPLWKVKKAWSGLGYYLRAANLWRACQEIERLGYFPKDSAELQKLPGFGPYLAGAVASIAFEVPTLPVDTNIRRVTLRILGKSDGTWYQMAEKGPLVPGTIGKPSEITQAFMELGALICKAKGANCSICPIKKFCKTKGAHSSEQKRIKNKKLELAIKLHRDLKNRILLVRRNNKELFLKDGWGLPTESLKRCPPKNGHKTFSHSIMKWRIHAHIEKRAAKMTGMAKVKWVKRSQLGRYLFSSLWWKALKTLSLILFIPLAGFSATIKVAAVGGVLSGSLPQIAQPHLEADVVIGRTQEPEGEIVRFETPKKPVALIKIPDAAVKNANATIKKLKGDGNIVIIDWREEKKMKKNELLKFGRGLIEAGADMVVGRRKNGPAAMELHKDRLIAYGLGDFAKGPICALLKIQLDGKTGAFVSGEIIPFAQNGNDKPVPDEKKQAIWLIKKLSFEEIPKNPLLVTSEGKLLNKKEAVYPVYRNTPIGLSASSADGKIALTLTGRLQHYNPAPQNPGDIYDPEIQSPKSAKFLPGGEKVYVNSLEGFTTVVYDAKTRRQTALIRHRFDEKSERLFSGQKPFDYEFLVKPPSGNVNHFAGKPVEMELTHNGRYLWVSYYRRSYDQYSHNPCAVAVIDTQKDEIVRVLPSGPIPKWLIASPDGKWMAFIHWGDNTVGFVDISAADPQNFKLSHLVAVENRVTLDSLKPEGGDVVPIDRDKECGFCLRGAVFTADSKYLLVGRMSGGGIAVIDVKEKKYVETVWGTKPTPRHLALSPDGQWLYASSNISGYVSKIKVKDLLDRARKKQKTLKPSAEIFAGHSVRTIEVSPDGRWVYAASNGDSKLIVLDADNLKKAAEIRVDSYPVGLAVSPDGGQVWVTSQGRDGQGGHSVCIYQIATP